MSDTLERTTTRRLLRALPQPLSYHGLQQCVLVLLAARPGVIISTAQLIDYMWGADPKGGPDDPENHIRVAIHTLRRAGHNITTHCTRGYSWAP